MSADLFITKVLTEAYERDGFNALPGCLGSRDVADIHREIARLWSSVSAAEDDPEVHWRSHAEKGRVADRIDPVAPRSAVFARLGDDPRIRHVAEALIGGEVFVLKDKLIMKTPGTSGYGVHQDLPYWEGSGLGADALVTAAVMLDDVTDAHGPITVFPGLHRARLPAHPDDPLDVDPASLVGAERYEATLNAGDVLFFHPLAPHASGPNRADGPRRTYLITYARRDADAERRIDAYRATRTRVHKAHRRTIA